MHGGSGGNVHAAPPQAAQQPQPQPYTYQPAPTHVPHHPVPTQVQHHTDPTHTEHHTAPPMPTNTEPPSRHPSRGSKGHPDGCKPCVKMVSKAGCKSGSRCGFCHYPHAAEAEVDDDPWESSADPWHKAHKPEKPTAKSAAQAETADRWGNYSPASTSLEEWSPTLSRVIVPTDTHVSDLFSAHSVVASRSLFDRTSPKESASDRFSEKHEKCVRSTHFGKSLSRPSSDRSPSPPTQTTQTRDVRLFGTTVAPARPRQHRPLRGTPYQTDHASLYPVFEWNEDSDTEAAGSPQPADVVKASAFNHSTTRIPGKEGLLVDTGAVDNLTGADFVVRQSAAAAQRGLPTQWEILRKPKRMSGVGDGTKLCTHQATVHGAIAGGALTSYTAPVIPGTPSPTPPLYGLRSMAAENTYFGTRTGLMALVPVEEEDQIVWPPGTRFLQCEAAPSGHWLLVMSEWNDNHGPQTQVTQAFPVSRPLQEPPTQVASPSLL